MKRFMVILLCLLLLLPAACAKREETPVKNLTQEVTAAPSRAQTVATIATVVPTEEQTTVPTEEPVATATEVPATALTEEPTAAPTTKPTTAPTTAPTTKATSVPTTKPTTAPTTIPTTKPTTVPTTAPTTKPTTKPTTIPTTAPATKPATVPTTAPTTAPTIAPTVAPTAAPTTESTEADEYLTYTDNFGVTYKFPVGSDYFAYTLSQAKLPDVNSRFPALEKLIYEKTNEERAKQGLAPLAWKEETYFFANTRAHEASILWDHTRPNGKPFYHIFAQYEVLPYGCGENLFNISSSSFTAEYIASQNGTVYFADEAVIGWMNSPGHRANILNESWGSVSMAVYYDDQAHKLFAVQLFFAEE